ncbi:MAG: squalene/phytoene synthase family protein, partial [Paludibacter sp.]
MDINFTRPRDWDELEEYCVYSANPIGELVLRIMGEYNESNALLSDKICTGLQLANFWQDFSVDLPSGRCYIPSDILFSLNIEISQES